MYRLITWWKRSRSNICGTWDDPQGGRDTHVCRLPKGHLKHHEPYHECKCEVRWRVIEDKTVYSVGAHNGENFTA